jgi:hypothetical protein
MTDVSGMMDISLYIGKLNSLALEGGRERG